MKRVAFHAAGVLILTLFSAGFVVPVATAQPAIAANEVRLCEHVDFVGYCHSFFLEPDMRQRLVPKLPSILQDKVSSIRVGDEVVALVYLNSEFLGPEDSYHNDVRDLGDEKLFEATTLTVEDWNDEISSLVIFRYVPHHGGSLVGVKLKQALNWDGEREQGFYPLPQDPSQTEARFASLGDYMNDEADHVSLKGAVEVELYEHENFAGKRLDLPAESGLSSFDLVDFGMEEKVSSLIVRYTGGKVEAKGGTPPLLPPERDGEAAGEPHRAPAAPVEAVVAGPITVPQAPSLTLEPNTDRPGHSYRDFDLRDARPELCRDACAAEPRCRAFTYVKPGIQGDSPRCWLKDDVARATNAPCCVSGIKQ